MNFIGPEWPSMQKFTLCECDQCIHFKSRPQKVVMENIKAIHSLQLVHLDNVTIEVTDGGKDVHILIITDHLMLYAQALATSSQTAKCTAQALWNWFIVHYGLPETIVSNQGLKFESVNSFQSYAIWQRYKNCILALITHIQTGNTNTSNIH